MECINTLIGLSRTTCECAGANKPAGHDTSESGYFIDELDGLNIQALNAAENCESGGLWDILARARENSIKDLVADVLADMSVEYESQVNFKGVIGNKKPTNRVEGAANNWRGLKIVGNGTKNGRLLITKLHIYNVSGEEINYRIVDEFGAEKLAATAYTLTAGWNVITLDTALELQLATDDGDFATYFLLFEGVEDTMDNRLDCGCSNWTHHYHWPPTFGDETKADRTWTNFVMLAGINQVADAGDPVQDIIDNHGTSTRSYGVRLECEGYCDGSDVICDNASMNGSSTARVMGRALQYRAGHYAIQSILDSGTINRFTLMNQESLWGKQSHFNKQYADRVAWLSQNMDVSQNGCFKCASRMNVGRL